MRARVKTEKVITAAANYIVSVEDFHNRVINKEKERLSKKKKYFFFGDLLNETEIDDIIHGRHPWRNSLGILETLAGFHSSYYDKVKFMYSYSVWQADQIITLCEASSDGYIDLGNDEVSLLEDFLKE